MFHSAFCNVNIFFITVAVIKTKKLTLVQYYCLDYEFYSDFTYFPTNVLSLFHDPMLHLVVMFPNSSILCCSLVSFVFMIWTLLKSLVGYFFKMSFLLGVHDVFSWLDWGSACFSVYHIRGMWYCSFYYWWCWPLSLG